MAKWVKSMDGDIEIYRVTMPVFEVMVWKQTSHKLWTINITVPNRKDPIIKSEIGGEDLLQAQMQGIHLASHAIEDEHLALAQAMQETHNAATQRRDEILRERHT